jgi:hypothetical protein
MTEVTIENIVKRWEDPNSRPLFKGKLIDNDGCCCAQGDILRLAGWSDDQLRDAEQCAADREVAKLLGISVAHACLLRIVNDHAEGCPQDVLDRPERVLGDKAPLVLRFWRLLDRMTPKQWEAASVANWIAAKAVAKGAAKDAAGEVAMVAAWIAASAAASTVASAVAGEVAIDAAARTAAWATNEIQGIDVLRKQEKPLFFLPLFGVTIEELEVETSLLPDEDPNLRREIVDVIGEEWLYAENSRLGGHAPQELIGTPDEFRVRLVLRSIKSADLS